jgi:SAM-dependent methyltransferase
VTVQTRYRSNYDQIARDHLRHWRAYGENPFQEKKHMESHLEATVRLISTHAPQGKMLDAGCGMGDLLACFPDRERVGVDISEAYLEVARERGLTVYRAGVEKMPFDTGTFALVTCTDVLEHVLDLNRAVKELLRVLKRGGVLIVRVPNEEELAVDTPPYEFVHLRRFDKPTLHLLFAKVFGRKVLEVSVDGGELHAVVQK